MVGLLLSRAWAAVQLAVVLQGAGFYLAEQEGTHATEGGQRGVLQQWVLPFQDTLDGAGIEAAVLLGPDPRGCEGFLAVGFSESQEGADVDGGEPLHAKLQSADKGGERGKALEERLLQSLPSRGGPAMGVGGVVGGVDDELALVGLRDVAAGEHHMMVGVQDLEMFGEQAHGNRAAGHRGGHGVAGAVDGKGGILIHDANALFVDGKTLVGQLDKELPLARPLLVGDPAGGSVEALIGDLWGFIEPDLQPPVQVLQGVELGAFEEVIPEQAEGFFLFALSIRIAHCTGKGLETVVAGELQKARMPDRLAVGPVVSEDRGGHVVQNQAKATAQEVLESTRQSLEQGGLTLVAVGVHPQLAGGAQQTPEHVDGGERAGDRQAVG